MKYNHWTYDDKRQTFQLEDSVILNEDGMKLCCSVQVDSYNKAMQKIFPFHGKGREDV